MDAMLEPFEINLQLLAGEDDDTDTDTDNEDEEELEDDGYKGGSDDNDDDSDSDDDADADEESEEEDEEDEEDEKPKKKVDKVTSALIDQKRKNKELERKLQAIQDEKDRKEQEETDKQRVKDLIAEGYGEAQAKDMVATDSRLATLERENQKLKFEKLEGRFPGITDHMREILAIQKKANGTLTIEEIYNAKFRTASEYDTKTKAEAAAVHKMKDGKKKKGADSSGGGGKNQKPVKLSPADEKIYRHLIKGANKNLTRKQYLDLAKGGEIEE